MTMAGFYSNINDEFGHEVGARLKNYADNNRKLCNMTNRKEFLLNCRKSGVFPQHIQNSFKCVFQLIEERSPFLTKLENCITYFKKKVLNLEIQHTFHRVSQLRYQQQQLKELINRTIPENLRTSFLSSQVTFYERQMIINRKKTNSKFQRLSVKTVTGCSGKTPSKNTNALHNATKTTLPPGVQLLLSLGPKFALPFNSLNEIPFYHLLADVEAIIKTENNVETQERTRCRIANNIQNFIHRHRHTSTSTPCEKLLKQAEMETKDFLKQHPELYILKADKGNKTVVMLKKDYVTRMEQLLSDSNTYQKTNKDPTSSFQSKNNDIIRRLENLGLLDRSTARRMRTYKAVCPKIYGQPKTHKPGLPLRPVVPCMTSPSYELSKYIGSIIQRSLHSKYNITDSFQFCQFVNTTTLPKDHLMVSFDVVSLFTCIPQELVRKSITMRWSEISQNTDICLDLFLEVTKYCIECSYFAFNGTFYIQKFGTAMGNPLSPIIADLVMEDLLDKAIKAVPFEIPCLKKYVDDLFLALPRDKVDVVKDIFNQQEASLKFTVEEEQHNRLPFLDMVIIRHIDQSMKTEWYMKPIASGRFLNYHSLHSLHHKMNVAYNFIKRVQTFSTNNSENQIKEIIKKQLLINDYPKSLISRAINRANQKQLSGTAMTTNETQPGERDKLFRSLTNIDGLSNQLTKTLHKDYPNIKVATKTIKTVGTLLPIVKDKTQLDDQNNVVYKIECNNCDACYIGMTTTKLKTRIAGHRSNIRRLQTLREAGYTNNDAAVVNIREKTALVDHAAAMDHQFKLTDTKIIDRTNKPSSLPILESCHIKNTPNTVNKRTDTDNLNVVYAGLLHTLGNIQKTKRRDKNKTNVNTTTTQNTNTIVTVNTTHE